MSTKNLASLLTRDECNEIVQKYNKETENILKIKEYEIVAATEAKGFLGEYFHLLIKCYKEENEQDLQLSKEKAAVPEQTDEDAILLKFFIKKPPLLQEEHEIVAIFCKESSLYATLLSELQKYSLQAWCPKVYLCHNNLIVLQDLESLGFKSLAVKKDLEELEMLPILNGLAAMHASSLIYELQNDNIIGDSFAESLKEITVHPEIPWFTTGLRALLEIAKHHAKYQSEVAQTFITHELLLHLKSIYFMINSSPKYRNVLCHRDTWGGNIFINPTNPSSSAIFVDFQTCRYCPPAIDVIFTLFMNLSKQERLAKQAKYLKYYYQQLKFHFSNFNCCERENIDLIISESEFLETIEKFELFGYVYRALAVSVLKVPKEFVTNSYKNEERSQKLLEYMKENEEFRLLMEECIEDIIEAVIN